MTDNNPALTEMDDYGSDGESRQARLDRVINSRNSTFSAAAQTPVNIRVTDQSAQPQYAYDTHRKVFINRNTGSTVPADEVERAHAANPSSERIHDDGRNLDATWDHLIRQWKDYERRYEEHTFDPVTGEKKYRLNASERAAVLKQWQSFDETVKYERNTLQRLAAQRAQDRANANQVAVDEAAMHETLRREAQKRAFEMEADELAKAILAEKRRLQSQRGY